MRIDSSTHLVLPPLLLHSAQLSSRSAPNASGAQIWETAVPPALAKAGFKGLTTLSPHRRVTRAR